MTRKLIIIAIVTLVGFPALAGTGTLWTVQTYLEGKMAITVTADSPATARTAMISGCAAVAKTLGADIGPVRDTVAKANVADLTGDYVPCQIMDGSKRTSYVLVKRVMK